MAKRLYKNSLSHTAFSKTDFSKTGFSNNKLRLPTTSLQHLFSFFLSLCSPVFFQLKTHHNSMDSCEGQKMTFKNGQFPQLSALLPFPFSTPFFPQHPIFSTHLSGGRVVRGYPSDTSDGRFDSPVVSYQKFGNLVAVWHGALFLECSPLEP